MLFYKVIPNIFFKITLVVVICQYPFIYLSEARYYENKVPCQKTYSDSKGQGDSKQWVYQDQ